MAYLDYPMKSLTSLLSGGAVALVGLYFIVPSSTTTPPWLTRGGSCSALKAEAAVRCGPSTISSIFVSRARLP